MKRRGFRCDDSSIHSSLVDGASTVIDFLRKIEVVGDVSLGRLDRHQSKGALSVRVICCDKNVLLKVNGSDGHQELFVSPDERCSSLFLYEIISTRIDIERGIQLSGKKNQSKSRSLKGIENMGLFRKSYAARFGKNQQQIMEELAKLFSVRLADMTTFWFPFYERHSRKLGETDWLNGEIFSSESRNGIQAEVNNDAEEGQKIILTRTQSKYYAQLIDQDNKVYSHFFKSWLIPGSTGIIGISGRTCLVGKGILRTITDVEAKRLTDEELDALGRPSLRFISLLDTNVLVDPSFTGQVSKLAPEKPKSQEEESEKVEREKDKIEKDKDIEDVAVLLDIIQEIRDSLKEQIIGLDRRIDLLERQQEDFSGRISELQSMIGKERAAPKTDSLKDLFSSFSSRETVLAALLLHSFNNTAELADLFGKILESKK